MPARAQLGVVEAASLTDCQAWEDDGKSMALKWTDSVLGSTLQDEAGNVLAKVRPLEAGGASAQWRNGMTWDVSDQLKAVKEHQAKLFATVPAAKRAVEDALQLAGHQG